MNDVIANACCCADGSRVHPNRLKLLSRDNFSAEHLTDRAKAKRVKAQEDHKSEISGLRKKAHILQVLASQLVGALHKPLFAPGWLQQFTEEPISLEGGCRVREARIESSNPWQGSPAVSFGECPKEVFDSKCAIPQPEARCQKEENTREMGPQEKHSGIAHTSSTTSVYEIPHFKQDQLWWQIHFAHEELWCTTPLSLWAVSKHGS